MAGVRHKLLKQILFYVVVVLLLCVTLFPLLWMLLASFKRNGDLLNVAKMFSFTPTLKNYTNVFV